MDVRDIFNVGREAVKAHSYLTKTVSLGGRIIKSMPSKAAEAFAVSEGEFTRTVYEVADFVVALGYLYRKSDKLSHEKLLTKSAEVASMGMGLAGRVTQFTESLAAIQIVGPKVASVAAKGTLVIGAASTVTEIGIDSFRAYQITRELQKGENIDLDTAHRVSFQALAGIKRSVLAKKERTPEFYQHMKNRFKWNLAFRSVAITAGVASIAGLILLTVAPTPLAPIAWGLWAAAAIMGLGALIGKYAVNSRLEKRLSEIPDKKVAEAAIPVIETLGDILKIKQD